MLCEKADMSCTRNGKHLHKGRLYCRTHFKKILKSSKPARPVQRSNTVDSESDSDGYDDQFPKQERAVRSSKQPKRFKPSKQNEYTDSDDSDDYDEYDESKYTPEWERVEQDLYPECCICLEIIKEEDMTTTCGHTFHIPCFGKWAVDHASCPLCRALF